MRTSLLLTLVSAAVFAQQPADWRDPSGHMIRFVTVGEGVRLEVLDWGGSGTPIVLLAGSGNTAHVFDDFAPKAAMFSRVYGITRRGYGASSQPAGGYDEPRLAQDVFEVIEALHIVRPVLVGHSMAGGEMTLLASGHPDRLTGLVYLDALTDPADFPAADPAYMALYRKLPPSSQAPPPPTPEENRSFSAYRARQFRTMGFAFPESELRATSEPTADGSKGKYRTPRSISNAIGEGARKRDYSRIRVPVLALSEAQRKPGDYSGAEAPMDADGKAATDAFRAATTAFINRWKANLRNGPPSVRFVDVSPGAGHYIFLTREADVLREVRAFVLSLH